MCVIRSFFFHIYDSTMRTKWEESLRNWVFQKLNNSWISIFSWYFERFICFYSNLPLPKPLAAWQMCVFTCISLKVSNVTSFTWKQPWINPNTTKRLLVVLKDDDYWWYLTFLKNRQSKNILSRCPLHFYPSPPIGWFLGDFISKGHSI